MAGLVLCFAGQGCGQSKVATIQVAGDMPDTWHVVQAMAVQHGDALTSERDQLQVAADGLKQEMTHLQEQLAEQQVVACLLSQPDWRVPLAGGCPPACQHCCTCTAEGVNCPVQVQRKQ